MTINKKRLKPGMRLSRQAVYILIAVAFTLSWSLPSLFWPMTAEAAINFRASSPGAVQNSGTSITIDKPAGTVEGDVMVATIVATGTGAISLSGWTSAVRTTESTTQVMETFWKAAGSSEPASYTFSLGLTAVAAIGGIGSYEGADTLAPIDSSGGNSKTHTTIGSSAPINVTANSINIRSHNTVLIAHFSITAQTGFTPPTGMNERYDTQTNCGTLCTNLTTEYTDVFPVASGASGDKTASTLSLPDGSYSLVGQQIALRPPTLDGNGLMIYGQSANTTPQTRSYTNFSNSFSAPTGAVAGTTGQTFMMRTSPVKQEAIAGYVDSAGTLQVMCYNGTSWSNEWTATVGGTGTTSRFDIAYETESGDVMVLYGTNASTTNELAYRTKPAGNTCGSANWTAAANLDPIRTTGVIHWVKAAWDKRPTSNLITATWVDSNADLSAQVWSGSAWGNEPAAVLDNSLEFISTAQDIDSFDVEYESLSGDVMVVWANSAGSNGINGVRYATCDGGTSNCTWSSVQTPPTFADDAHTLDISGNPTSDEIVFASIGDAGDDMQAGYWSGSTWTNTANIDETSEGPTVRTRRVATGWLNAGGTVRSIVVYNDTNSGNIGWMVGNGGAFTMQADATVSPGWASPQNWYDIQVDPVNRDSLMLTVAANNADLAAKRLVMTSAAAFTWTNSDGGVALEDNLPSIGRPIDFAFAYWQHSTFEQSAYRWFANADSITPGASLGAQNTRVEPGSGPVRLRLLLHVGGTSLQLNDRMFKLQFSPKSGTCDTALIGENYTDVVGVSGDITFYNNPTPVDAAAISAVGGDPGHSNHITLAQTYEESNTFINRVFTPTGQEGLWDFALTANGAFGAYCFRVANSDSGRINSYTHIPEIVFCDLPKTENVIRGGNYFCDGTENNRFFWSR